MLGLRVDSDPYFSSLNKNAQQFKKSSRFANNLSGRFFVSGISGGFEKHKKLLATIKDQETKNENAENQGVLKTKRILYNHQPVLERLIKNCQTSLEKLQSLKTGLMQDLLSGKVSVKINDETLLNP
jgi:hypothetical protein